MRKVKFYLLYVSFFAFCFNCLVAQTPENFKPYPLVKSDSLLKVRIQSRLKTELDSIKYPNKEGKEIIANNLKSRAEIITDDIKDGEYLIGSSIDSFVQKVTNNIIKANPELNGKVTVLVSKNTEPNAFCYGNGIVVFNIGLLNRYRSESQIAYTLCHEFSHQILNHNNRNIYTKAYKATDKELLKELKTIAKSEFYANKKITERLLTLVSELMSYSRDDEMAADSLGYKFFLNTDYNLLEAQTTMDILDSLEIQDRQQTIELKKFFTLPQVPPGKYWFDYNSKSSLAAMDKDTFSFPDSLKTHPDCKVRKAKLASYPRDNKQRKLNIQSQESFDAMKFNSKYEIIQTYLDYYENLSLAIYSAIFALESNPKDVYPRALIAYAMAFIGKEKVALNSSSYINLPQNERVESYNRLLTFLQEISPAQTSELGYWMVRPVDETLKKEEIYLAALTMSAFATKKYDEFTALKAEYDTAFKDGRYTKELDRCKIPVVKTKK